FVAGGRRLASELVKLSNGRYVPADGGVLQAAVRQLRHVPRDRRHGGWQVAELVMLAVALESTQVGRVAALGIGRALQAGFDIPPHRSWQLHQRMRAGGHEDG
nr:hypothetical protein [Tanacetum cinerariifolium]